MADKYKEQRYSVYFFNPDTLARIKKLAKEQNRSISNVICDACNSYLALTIERREFRRKY